MGKKLAVSLPDTVLEEKDSPRDKTTKLGLIARACAIYGVDLIEVFHDPRGRGEASEIRKVLEYLETPQYLRRRLYPLEESLRYAGVLPPLRIPSHKARIPADKLVVGDIREGVTNDDGTVDIGLDLRPILGGRNVTGRRVTVKISSLKPLTAEPISKNEVGIYWGYAVEEKTTEEVLRDRRFGIKIATSRMGTPVADVLRSLRASVAAAGGVKLLFGSPTRGLFDIFGRDLPGKVDFVVNLYSAQQVETVRTEEAIFAGLGLVSLLGAEKA